MRAAVLEFIKSRDIGSFRVSKELPWSDSTQPLYIKNLKTLYIGPAQFETDTIIATLGGQHIQSQTIIIQTTFGCDAKQLPSNYETVITQLLDVSNITNIGPEWDRKVAHTVSYEGDVLITQVDYTFTKLYK